MRALVNNRECSLWIERKMIENAIGLILRTRPLTETSLIVHWLTPGAGRIATVAKGARRPRSTFHGKLDLFYLADFSFQRGRRSDLHTLREVMLRQTHAGLRRDLERLEQACYCALLIEQTTETDTPLESVFGLMLKLLEHLQKEPAAPHTVFAFELKLLEELGLAPQLDQTSLTAGTQRLAGALVTGDWEVIGRLRPSGAQNAELRSFLHGYLIYHLGKVPHERSAAVRG